MIAVVTSKSGHHKHVRSKINELQEAGWEVLAIERMRRRIAGLGENVSYIHYRNPHLRRSKP